MLEENLKACSSSRIYAMFKSTKRMSNSNNLRFTLHYNGERDFRLWHDSQVERDKWVEAIQFMKEIEDKV